jgi:uncharacterized OB-fold protein
MGDQDFFWEGVDRGKLLFQRCAGCGAVRQPLGPMCPKCQSLEWEPQEAAGKGVIRAWIVSKHPTRPDANPRLVVLVELDDGPRLVSNLIEAHPEDVRLGMPVEVVFEDVDGVFLHQFRLAGAGATQ